MVMTKPRHKSVVNSWESVICKQVQHIYIEDSFMAIPAVQI